MADPVLLLQCMWDLVRVYSLELGPVPSQNLILGAARVLQIQLPLGFNQAPQVIRGAFLTPLGILMFKPTIHTSTHLHITIYISIFPVYLNRDISLISEMDYFEMCTQLLIECLSQCEIF